MGVRDWLHARKLAMQRWARRLTAKPPDVCVVVSTCGESTERACLRAIARQTRPFSIVLLRNVHPMSAMNNEALRLCAADWLLRVDADMILAPNALRCLTAEITSPRVALVTGTLMDKVRGPLHMPSLLNASILKQWGFTYPIGDPRSDTAAERFLREHGFETRHIARVIGEHDPYATTYEMFRRFHGSAVKERGRLAGQAREILRYYRRTGDDEAVFFMLSGLVMGASLGDLQDRDYVEADDLDAAYQTLRERF